MHPNSSPLYPYTTINKVSKPHIEKLIKGDELIDNSRRLFLKSKYLLASGEYESACIIACTSCEIALTDKLKNKLKKVGLGKKAIKDAIDNITLSQLIKLISNYIYPSTNKVVFHLLSDIDKLRKIRNEIVHDGVQLSIKNIDTIKNSIESLEKLLSVKY